MKFFRLKKIRLYIERVVWDKEGGISNDILPNSGTSQRHKLCFHTGSLFTKKKKKKRHFGIAES